MQYSWTWQVLQADLWHVQVWTGPRFWDLASAYLPVPGQYHSVHSACIVHVHTSCIAHMGFQCICKLYMYVICMVYTMYVICICMQSSCAHLHRGVHLSNVHAQRIFLAGNLTDFAKEAAALDSSHVAVN